MIPLTLLFAICGTIGIGIYFSKRKKSKFRWLWLVLGTVLLLMAIIPWIALSLN